MNGHQRYFLTISFFIIILICQQRNFRKEIAQCDVVVAFLLPLCAKVAHAVCKLFDVLLAAEVFGRVVLTDVTDDTRLANDLRTKFIGVFLGNALNKAGHQITETLQFGHCPLVYIHSVGQRLAKHSPQTYIVVGSGSGDFAYSSVAYSTCGIVDDTLKGFFIIRIDSEAEIGDCVFYLLTLVEGQTSIDAVRHTAFAHGFLENAALRIRAV